MTRSFDPALVARLREVPLRQAIEALEFYVAVDRDFVPVRDVSTVRWIVTVAKGNVELLVTGSKWFDTREQKGGGGSIDLVMYLTGQTFVQVVKRFRVAGL